MATGTLAKSAALTHTVDIHPREHKTKTPESQFKREMETNLQ